MMLPRCAPPLVYRQRTPAPHAHAGRPLAHTGSGLCAPSLALGPALPATVSRGCWMADFHQRPPQWTAGVWNEKKCPSSALSRLFSGILSSFFCSLCTHACTHTRAHTCTHTKSVTNVDLPAKRHEPPPRAVTAQECHF